MHRREFLGMAFAATAGAVFGPGRSLASGGQRPSGVTNAAPVPGVGPYGPLQPPNADGIQLPAGFRSRLIATSGTRVGATSLVWHALPDGGASTPRAGGGWLYISNGERDLSGGGVSVIAFDPTGAIVDAYRILTGTTRSCSGGMTPWGTYLSGEEYAGGNVFECDPQRPSQGIRRPALGTFPHEMIAVDPISGDVYMVEDHALGRFYRFVPTHPGDLRTGSLYAAKVVSGVVQWVAVAAGAPARGSNTTVFAGGEGLDIFGRWLFMTTKHDVRVLALDLDTKQLFTFYDGLATPQASLDAVDNLIVHRQSTQLFVAEDGGNMEVGVLTTGDPAVVAPFLRIVGQDASEVTGIAFDPSGTRLYLSSQRGADGITGRTYEVSGPFTGTSLGSPPAVAARSAVRLRAGQLLRAASR